jgi:hypothetical protein
MVLQPAQTIGSGLGTFMLQSADHSLNADVDENRDALGNVVQRTFYNQNEDATLEVLVIGTGVADAISKTTLPTVGSVISITACASYTALVATNWVVDSSSMKGGNTDAKKASFKLKRHAGVTAQSGA